MPRSTELKTLFSNGVFFCSCKSEGFFPEINFFKANSDLAQHFFKLSFLFWKDKDFFEIKFLKAKLFECGATFCLS